MLLSSSIENYIKVNSSMLYYDKLLQLDSIQNDITLCNVSFNKRKSVQLVKKFPSFIKPKKLLFTILTNPRHETLPSVSPKPA